MSAVLLMGAAAVYGHKAFNSNPEVSDLVLENAEAMADDEQNRCDNFNGYRRIQPGNEKVYDCCYKEQVGRGKDDCKRY